MVNKVYIVLEPPSALKSPSIIAGQSSPTQHLSEILKKILSPIVREQESYIKDDWDLLSKLPYHNYLGRKLLSCDVISLYTSIPNDLGLETLHYWINRCRRLKSPRFTNGFNMESAKFVLTNNNLNFDGQIYNQLIGTAMDTDFAPDYIHSNMECLEEKKLFPNLHNHFCTLESKSIEENHLRYIDDGFLLYQDSIYISVYKHLLNNMHPDINFTFESPKYILLPGGSIAKKLYFLAFTIIFHQSGKIDTDIFYKDTNNHNYPNYESHHSNHIKSNIPYNPAKRIIVFAPTILQ